MSANNGLIRPFGEIRTNENRLYAHGALYSTASVSASVPHDRARLQAGLGRWDPAPFLAVLLPRGPY
jgi:hypothetical protein